MRRLPTLNRDMYDFVRLVPQVGTRFGLRGAGAGFASSPQPVFFFDASAAGASTQNLESGSQLQLSLRYRF